MFISDLQSKVSKRVWVFLLKDSVSLPHPLQMKKALCAFFDADNTQRRESIKLALTFRRRGNYTRVATVAETPHFG